MSRKLEIALLALILLLGGFLRFYKITSVPPGLYPDEAMNGNNALEALSTGNFKVFYPENNGREGLFINLQAISVKAFGNEPWALRAVSAVFGTLTILGVYLLARELLSGFWHQTENEKLKTKNFVGKLKTYQGEFIALFSAFFLATSYWHINFSRIGFRAITVPFFAVFGLYFLLKGLRRKNLSTPQKTTGLPVDEWGLLERDSGDGAISLLRNTPRVLTPRASPAGLPVTQGYHGLARGASLDLIWAGIFSGLGFHTYIAFRFMPFVLVVPLIWYFRQTKKVRFDLLFLAVIFIVALPIGFYFLQNPADFFGRGGQVSVFSSVSPAAEFLKSNLLTLGMFFARGDCNWRHNYPCNPALYPLVGLFFIVGAIFIIKKAWKRNDSSSMPSFLLLAWLFFMSLPATLTREGMPHALRSIGLIPPVMILAGLGAWFMLERTLTWLAEQEIKQPQYLNQIRRIQKEICALFILALLLVPLTTYRLYFLRWAPSAGAYSAFSADLLHIGQFLNRLPAETKKYVVVNLPGMEVRGIPMPAQTVMFATDTFTEKKMAEKNFDYILPRDLDKISVMNGQKTVIVFLDSNDREFIYAAQRKFPELKIQVPGDFTILTNLP